MRGGSCSDVTISYLIGEEVMPGQKTDAIMDVTHDGMILDQGEKPAHETFPTKGVCKRQFSARRHAHGGAQGMESRIKSLKPADEDYTILWEKTLDATQQAQLGPSQKFRPANIANI